MRAAVALLLALAALPATLPSSSALAPDVEVRSCEALTWGWAVYVNDRQTTHCGYGQEGEEPDVEYRRCDPPTFGYAVWVNGDQVAYCMI